MFEIPANAPAWVFYAYWAAFAVFGALFMVLTPRLRSLMGKLTAPPADPGMRAVSVMGAAVGMSQDAPKIAHELERIADAAEEIAKAAAFLARSEEIGTHRAVEDLGDLVRRLGDRLDAR